MNVINQTLKNNYALYHGDSVEITKEIPDNSIHYTLFSPPFHSFMCILILIEIWAIVKMMMNFIVILSF